MPLYKSASKKAVGKNISKEMHAGKSQKQAIAIALSTQREAKKKKRKNMQGHRGGLIHGDMHDCAGFGLKHEDGNSNMGSYPGKGN